MFDPKVNTLQPVMQPIEGVMITDIVATQPRTLPAEIVDQQPGVTLNQDLANAGVGEIDIRSVYDFDGVDTAKPSTVGVAKSSRDGPESAPRTLHPPGEAGGHSGPADPEAGQRGLRRHWLHA
ncbi:MAG: hypothetical protein WDM77_19610 [Steroidobacteraceae bacterium]